MKLDGSIAGFTDVMSWIPVLRTAGNWRTEKIWLVQLMMHT